MSKRRKAEILASGDARYPYERCRAEAQRLANETGFDFGIQRNTMCGGYEPFTLPDRKHRCGFELSCEVVHCEILERCQAGHGPNARSAP